MECCVEGRMPRTFTLRTLLYPALLLGMVPLANAQDLAQTSPSPYSAYIADDIRIGQRKEANGTIPVDLPIGTQQVDILDARGEVVERIPGWALNDLDLAHFERGTWTLRAHLPQGFVVRRFLVLRPGEITWALPAAGPRNAAAYRATRRPLD